MLHAARQLSSWLTSDDRRKTKMSIAVIPYTQWIFSLVEYAGLVGLGIWFLLTQPKRIQKKLSEGRISQAAAVSEKKKVRWIGGLGVVCFLYLLISQFFSEHI